MRYPLSLVFFFSVLSSHAQDGQLDFSYGTSGFVQTNIIEYDRAASATLQQDGKLLVIANTGIIPTDNGAVVRYLSTGILDQPFGTNGIVITSDDGIVIDWVQSIAVQPDSKIVVGASRWANGFGHAYVVARYYPDGSADSDFGTSGKAMFALGNNDLLGYGIGLQSNGEVVVGGAYGSGMFAMARFLTDGSLDSTFGDNGFVSLPIAGDDVVQRNLFVRSDDKIVAVGTVSLNDSTYLVVARFLADGILDPDFGSNGLVYTPMPSTWLDCTSALISADGKLVCGGQWDGFGGTGAFVVRYLDTGELDDEFAQGGILLTYEGDGLQQPRGIASDSEGRIILTGSTSYTAGFGIGLAIRRYLNDGTPDPNFGIGGLVNTLVPGDDQLEAQTVLCDQEGRILVSGTKYNNSFTAVDLFVARYVNDVNVGTADAGQSDYEVELHPNPVSDVLMVNVHHDKPMEYIIYNSIGERLMSDRMDSDQLRVNVMALSDGAYVIELHSDNAIVRRKLVVAR